MEKVQNGSLGFSKNQDFIDSPMPPLRPERREGSDMRDSQLESQLRERVKELDCLYNLTKLIERCEHSIDKILQGVVDLIPVSWQYPEITCARILYKERTYQSNNFKSTQWKQEAVLMISGRQEGVVEVYYLKKMPLLDEGPFLKEERLLIGAISDHIAKAVERIIAPANKYLNFI